ncbi:hypothetical protein ABTY14_39945, partial [Streptomyces hydrogenans]
MSPAPLPPVAPEVLAEAVEQLTARLRKKLDAAVAECAGKAVTGSGGTVEVRFGEDTLVTLRPGPSGAVTEPGQAVCSCLLAPRCLHRAAVLGAAPLADADTVAPAVPPAPESPEGTPPSPVAGAVTTSPAPVATEEARPSLTPAQVVGTERGGRRAGTDRSRGGLFRYVLRRRAARRD